MLSALTERLVGCSRCYPERLDVLVRDENNCGALGVKQPERLGASCVKQEDLVLPLLGEKTLSSVASAVRREDL